MKLIRTLNFKQKLLNVNVRFRRLVSRARPDLEQFSTHFDVLSQNF